MTEIELLESILNYLIEISLYVTDLYSAVYNMQAYVELNTIAANKVVKYSYACFIMLTTISMVLWMNFGLTLYNKWNKGEKHV